MKNISIKAIIATGFIFAIILLFISYLKDQRSKTQVMKIEQYVLNSFITELPDINKNLPYQVDANTELISINYKNKKIVSRYRLSKESSEIISGTLNLSGFMSQIKTKECKEKSKIVLIDAGIDLINTYEDPNGKILINLPLNSVECAPQQSQSLQ